MGTLILTMHTSADGFVATDDGIKRAVQADEQHGELERLGAALQQEFLPAHARDRGFRDADDGRQHPCSDVEQFRSAQRGPGENRVFSRAGGDMSLHGGHVMLLSMENIG